MTLTLNADDLLPATPPNDPRARSVRGFTGIESSLRRAFWNHRLARITDLFSGGTSEEDEAAALRILLRTDSGAEAGHYIRQLSWGVLDDELVEDQVTQWAQHVGNLHSRANNRVARFVQASVSQATDVPLAEQHARYQEIWSALSLARRREVASLLTDERAAFIQSAARTEMLGGDSRVESLREFLEVMVADEAIVSDGLEMARWQAFYVPRFAEQLRDLQVGLLLRTLIDLIDPELPDIRRIALFDLYHIFEPEVRCLEVIVDQLGDAEQERQLQRFIETRQLFLDEFQETDPDAELIAELAEELGGEANELADLRAVVAAIADDITGINLDSLLNEVEDDLARAAIDLLASQDRLRHVPLNLRIELCRRCLEGSTEDEDEGSILRVLRATKGASVAEFFLIVSGLTWEALDFSIDGDESDTLYALLTDV